MSALDQFRRSFLSGLSQHFIVWFYQVGTVSNWFSINNKQEERLFVVRYNLLTLEIETMYWWQISFYFFIFCQWITVLLGCLSGYYGTTCTWCNHSGCAADFCHSLDGSCVCASNNFDVTTCPEGTCTIQTYYFLFLAIFVWLCPEFHIMCMVFVAKSWFLVFPNCYLLHLGVLCKSGWFGKYCDQRCSNHCNVSYECYQGNGTCIGGCADGWTSDRCDQGKTRNHNESSWLHIELTFDRFYEGVHRNFQKS